MALLLAAVAWPGNAVAQQESTLCGALRAEGQYGPYDYRTQRDKLSIVEQYHFTPAVENLIHGESSSLGGELNYTLRMFPNHHRALVALMRLAERTKSPQPEGAKFTVECYFNRALRFAPDDTITRGLYATYLIKSNRVSDATAQLDRASRDAADNPFAHYNIGLLYVDVKLYDKALREAHRAIELGFPRMDLANALKAAGRWTEPTPRAAESAAMPAARASEPAPPASRPRAAGS
jgi:tetratricopeptide (TPR) repeat protein